MTVATILSKAALLGRPGRRQYASQTVSDPVSPAADAAADGAADGAVDGAATDAAADGAATEGATLGAGVAEPLHAAATRVSAPKRATILGVLCI